MQDFGEVVPDCYEIVEGNDLRVQAIDSRDGLSEIVGRDLVVEQLSVTLLKQTAPKGDPVSVSTPNIDILMRVLSHFQPFVGYDAFALTTRVEPADEVFLSVSPFSMFIQVLRVLFGHES